MSSDRIDGLVQNINSNIQHKKLLNLLSFYLLCLVSRGVRNERIVELLPEPGSFTRCLDRGKLASSCPPVPSQGQIAQRSPP
jgi:hypothetical protein